MIFTERILAHRGRIQNIREGRFPYPVFAILHFSYACSQKCKGCAYSGWNNGYVMEEEKAFRVVESLLTYGIKNFEFGGGGEPTMLPYLPKLIEYIIMKEGNYGILTNGVLLQGELAEMLAKTASYIRVSVETGNREEYRKYKGINDFDTVRDNVLNLLAIRDKDTQVSLKFNKLTEDGECDYGEFTGLDVDSYQCKRIVREGSPETDYPYIQKCYLNQLHTVIDAYGDVYLCCYYYEREEAHRIGNILESSFYSIWGSDTHKKALENIDMSICRRYDCRFFKYHKIIDDISKRGRADFL